MAKTRRRFTSVEKAAIVRRHLFEKTPISDLCDEHRIQPTQVYTWQKQLLDNASQAFERPKRSSKQEQAREDRIEALEAQLRQKNEVVAQLLDEHFALKKQLGPQ